MLFNSFAFLVLVSFTFLIYYLPYFRKIQVILLIGASFIFYGWENPQLLILLLLSIFINGITSFKIAYVPNKQKVRWALFGILFNLAILSLFKYGALFTKFISINLDQSILPFLFLPLPIGISFYTFEGISLLVDAFRNKSNPEKASFIEKSLKTHLIKTSFFIAFFPHLIAGPILKANNFYPQIKPKYFNQIPWNVVFSSLVVGYFLKMVIADNLKDYTFWLTFPYYQSLSTITAVILLFGYSIQIFADFAGYSLIAIGTAAAFAYTLPQNFNYPYISRSLSEFWRRWHISLSSWLKDYLYIPLGGNKKGKVRTYINLMIVMILGGLWHGAAWSYAIWGCFHGVGLVIERLFNNHIKVKFNKPLDKWQQFIVEIISIILVFSLVSLGWLLFKLPDFGQVLDFLRTMKHNFKLPINQALTNPVLIFSLPVVVYHLLHLPALSGDKIDKFKNSGNQAYNLFKDIVLGGMLVMIILNSGSPNEFIYFQF